VGDRLIRHREPMAFSGKIALIEGLVVYSYVKDGTRLADVLDRTGTPVQTEVPADTPLAFAKQVGGGLFARFLAPPPKV
jgi:hypothetical protein